MTPEAKARQNIDALLVAEGWQVCNVAASTRTRDATEANSHLSIPREIEGKPDANLRRA